MGFLSAVRQPFFFQPWIHLEAPSSTYLLSVLIVTVHGRFSASRPEMTPISSMRLLVVAGSPPLSSRSRAPIRRIAAQPPGPGLPLQAPSVKSSTSGASIRGPSSKAIVRERRRGAMEAQIGEIFERVLALHQRVGGVWIQS